MVVDDPTQLGDFVREARRMLAQPVGELKQDPRSDSILSRSIPETATACQAAVLMHDHNLPWLGIHDAEHQIIGSIDKERLTDVNQLLSASAYLGSELLADILPDLEINEVEPT
jgi:CBS-domain-containing membrane protein